MPEKNFVEENKELLIKVYNTLKLVYPNDDVTLVQLMTGAEGYIEIGTSTDNKQQEPEKKKKSKTTKKEKKLQEQKSKEKQEKTETSANPKVKRAKTQKDASVPKSYTNTKKATQKTSSYGKSVAKALKPVMEKLKEKSEGKK